MVKGKSQSEGAEGKLESSEMCLNRQSSALQYLSHASLLKSVFMMR